MCDMSVHNTIKKQPDRMSFKPFCGRQRTNCPGCIGNVDERHYFAFHWYHAGQKAARHVVILLPPQYKDPGMQTDPRFVACLVCTSHPDGKFSKLYARADSRPTLRRPLPWREITQRIEVTFKDLVLRQRRGSLSFDQSRIPTYIKYVIDWDLERFVTIKPEMFEAKLLHSYCPDMRQTPSLDQQSIELLESELAKL